MLAYRNKPQRAEEGLTTLKYEEAVVQMLFSIEGKLLEEAAEKENVIVWPMNKNIKDPYQEISQKSELIENYCINNEHQGPIYAWNYITDIVLKVAKTGGDLKDLIDIVNPDHIWWPDVVYLHPDDVIFGLVISSMFPGCNVVFTEVPPLSG